MPKKAVGYYDIAAALRASSRVLHLGPWPEWPHLYLVNMKLDEASLRAFSNNFGRLHGNQPVTVAAVRRAQNRLRAEWKDRVERMPGGWTGARDLKGDFALRMTPDGTVEIIARDLWEFAYLAFLRDSATGRTRICANPSCQMPYFLQTKQGQMYCSRRCAVAVSVRRFRSK